MKVFEDDLTSLIFSFTEASSGSQLHKIYRVPIKRLPKGIKTDLELSWIIFSKLKGG
jgi:hypothetical protein